MNPNALNQSQLDLLFQAGIYGLCRIPARSVEDVNPLREAGLVALNDEHCFPLTAAGERHVAWLGGKLAARHLH